MIDGSCEKNLRSICLAAGGSGGHIIPAQALAHKLVLKGYSIFFAADRLSTNRFFAKKKYSYFDIPSKPFFYSSPQKFISFLFHLISGTWKGFWLLRRHKPAICIGFGSYHTVSILIAAYLNNIPIVLHEANAHPGRVIRIFARYARWVGCYFSDAEILLQAYTKETKLVDLPLRQELMQMETISRQTAHTYFSNFHSSIYTILIVGGSQGAQKINQLAPYAIYETIKNVISSERQEKVVVQVIHIAGSISEADSLTTQYNQYTSIQPVVKHFEPNMQYALRAADLVICRSGASTLAEVEKAQIPAILIPYRYAMDDHQTKNAHAFIRKGMRGVILSDKDLCHESLSRNIAMQFGMRQEVRLQQELEYESNLKNSCKTSFSDAIEQTIDEILTAEKNCRCKNKM